MQPTPEKTTLPGPVRFSIEGDVYRRADPLVEGDQDELYGPDFAGTFEVKFPTLAQSLEIPARTTAAIEAFGVRNAPGIPKWAYDVYAALTYLGVIATVKPPWFALDADGTPKLMSAIIAAAETAEQKLSDGKKKSAGIASSTGT